MYIFFFFALYREQHCNNFHAFSISKSKKNVLLNFCLQFFFFSPILKIHTGYIISILFSRIWKIRSGNFFFLFFNILQLYVHAAFIFSLEKQRET